MNQSIAPLAAKGVFIDNQWRPAASGRTLPMIAPAEGVAFAAIAAGDARDVDRAVAAARRAFEEGAWGRLNAAERGRLLTKLGRLIEDHIEELTAIEARDTGKPMKQARADAHAVARYFEFYGGAADKWHGETIPFLDGYFVATVYEPKGVTGHIIPWNYPSQMFGRTIAASLAVGNACVMKPAEDACLAPLFLAELAAEAGFPEGALNIVPGLGEEAGAALAAHRGVDFLSFTGSAEVGTHGSDGGGEEPYRLHLGAWRKVAADRVRRRRSRGGLGLGDQRHRAERRSDLLGRLARCCSMQRSGTASWPISQAASPR